MSRMDEFAASLLIVRQAARVGQIDTNRCIEVIYGDPG